MGKLIADNIIIRGKNEEEDVVIDKKIEIEIEFNEVYLKKLNNSINISGWNGQFNSSQTYYAVGSGMILESGWIHESFWIRGSGRNIQHIDIQQIERGRPPSPYVFQPSGAMNPHLLDEDQIYTATLRTSPTPDIRVEEVTLDENEEELRIRLMVTPTDPLEYIQIDLTLDDEEEDEE